MTQFKRHLITSALPYGNGPIHIGQVAGAYLPADIYVRYLRLKGEDVAFICGADEHGVPITLQARKEGIHPQELVDKYYESTKKSFEDFGIAFDIFHRTSEKIHYETAQDFFLKLYEQGILNESESEQYYDEQEGRFLSDRYIIGTCPSCGYEKAYGDQCEKCGSSLSSKELIDPVSALSGEKPVTRTTKHWYLPLDQYEDWLRKWILQDHKDDWKSNVYGQCKSWLDQGLKPRAMTRDLEWGVPVPLEGTDGKVLYVWFDAPIGYVSATKAWAQQRAEENPEQYSEEDWKLYWQDSETRLVHFVGKDNIVFHCIIFPVMLKAHGDYIVPDNVPANEFLNLEGDKLSTSRGWAIWLDEYLEEFKGKEDVLRYVITANSPETKDNDFNWDDFQSKNNNELVAILGNFVHRVIVLTHKYFEGQVPESGEFGDQEQNIKASLPEFPKKIGQSLDQYRQREALLEMMNMARLGNKYLTETEPWKLWKAGEQERTATILHLCLQITANLSTLCEPFLPFTAEKIRKMLNIDRINWDETGSLDLVEPGHAINQAEFLFEKIDDATIQQQRQKLRNRAPEKEEPKQQPIKEAVNFDDFTKLDIRTGKITDAEKIPKANKLLKVKVDIGVEERVVVAGIAQQYKPEDIIGQRVAILANLAPKKLKGVESHGMMLMAEDEEGNLSFLQPGDDLPTGSVVR